MSAEVKLPQPGEVWRVRVSPAEWACPGCGKRLHEATVQEEGRRVLIVEPSSATLWHRGEEGCGMSFTRPAGWVQYTYGGGQVGALPYTYLEPTEEE